MTDFSPETVSARIRQAIRPQLNRLRDLERQYTFDARTEQLRRVYDMHDATDTEVRYHAMGAAIGNTYRQISKAVTSIYEGFSNFLDTLKSGLTNTEKEPTP